MEKTESSDLVKFTKAKTKNNFLSQELTFHNGTKFHSERNTLCSKRMRCGHSRMKTFLSLILGSLA